MSIPIKTEYQKIRFFPESTGEFTNWSCQHRETQQIIGILVRVEEWGFCLAPGGYILLQKDFEEIGDFIKQINSL